MEIELKDIGRRFGRDWIFRHVQWHIPTGTHALIVGRNGSGKSTLLQILSGFLSPSEGTLLHDNEAEVDPYSVSLAAPYLDVFDDLTLKEQLAFHLRFRPFREGISAEEVPELLELTAHRGKRIGNFSSGMRQRVRLGLAILSDAPLLLLDEPTSNLDKQAIAWYRALLAAHGEGRTVIVSSNHQTDDYLRADLTLDVGDFRG